MSLARTALRLQVIEALNSHPVIDGQCQGRIYDSRIGNFDDKEPVPVITVSTEDLSGEGWNPQNGGAPFKDSCNLVLDIGMAQFVEDADGGDFYFQPGTDSELEAALDLIEQCAEWILTTGMPHPRARQKTHAGRLLMSAVTRRVSKRDSQRFSPDDGGERLAIHMLTFRVELKGEDVETYAVPPGPFGALPDPLRTVAQSLTEGSASYLTCLKIAQDLARAITPATTPPSQPVVVPDSAPGTLPTELSIDFPQVP
ncbi:hypothetical protein [Methylobacterium pseudosasicola]|uniref:Uncharacterized protein n=1 Tax=Methylobacterium pseudosasicola TaxID=582667 RepID=A0A1I4TI44_9HYPH|nr:hypothetical protein [Methylobacterium pseudosasicola]SFM76394.1 hypothetical protein SAMN05192568_105411 [Methylobacterium pseudosasicola]